MRVVVPLDGGSDEVVDARPVRATVPAGAVVALRHAGSGRTSTHLLTSARPGTGPHVFTRVAAGARPNAAVWGFCSGGAATTASVTCPVPPVEGPREWDGEQYLSLGAVLAGETRELRLSPALAGRELRLWCSLHPALEVALEVGAPPSAPASPPPLVPEPVPVPPAGQVLVGPDAAAGRQEVLGFVPAQVRVPVGGTVTWRADGPSPHTVELGATPELGDTTPAEAAPLVPPGGYDGTGPARSGLLSTDPGAPGGTAFSVRFVRAGRFPYACRVHPGMTGTVVVG